MRTDIQIIEIGTKGLPRVQALAHVIWPEAFAGIIPAERIPGMLAEIYALETLATDMSGRGHRYWIATADGADAGLGSAYQDGDRVWIKKLYVREACRGLGLGKQLMDTGIAAFPAASSVGLYVNNGNAPAIAFYRSRGFAVEAEVPVRMGPYDFTDLVMGQPLPVGG